MCKLYGESAENLSHPHRLQRLPSVVLQPQYDSAYTAIEYFSSGLYFPCLSPPFTFFSEIPIKFKMNFQQNVECACMNATNKSDA